jgi:chromosomal replication initiation ATPase DnaA
VSRQLRLDLNRTPEYRREDFIVSAATEAATAALADWRNWPSGAACLVGPEGSGKTHLSRIWAGETAAVVLDAAPGDLAVLRGRAALIDGAERPPDAEALFHLMNMAAAGEATLLLTSRLRPSAWPAALPDLRSRLNALHVVEIGEPDDAALRGMLLQLFKARNIVPAEDLVPYLLIRMDRSFAGARRIVEVLDEAGAARGREVNRALAVEVLEVDNVINDLLG